MSIWDDDDGFGPEDEGEDSLWDRIFGGGGYEPSPEDPEVTLYDWDQQPVSLPLSEWLDLALESSDYNAINWNMGTMDIMYQLDDQELIDSEDWDRWRGAYEELYG